MQSLSLVLAMGNDILGDDGVGLLAARRLAARDGVDIVESSEAGLALLEHIIGYRNLLILDSVKTGKQPPGTVLRYTADDFRTIVAPSPHYAGLPEVLALGARLGVSMPSDIRVLAMEVEDPYTLREELTPTVHSALAAYVAAAEDILGAWASDGEIRPGDPDTCKPHPLTGSFRPAATDA